MANIFEKYAADREVEQKKGMLLSPPRRRMRSTHPFAVAQCER